MPTPVSNSSAMNAWESYSVALSNRHLDSSDLGASSSVTESPRQPTAAENRSFILASP